MKRKDLEKWAKTFEDEYKKTGDNAGTELHCNSVAKACSEIKKRYAEGDLDIESA